MVDVGTEGVVVDEDNGRLADCFPVLGCQEITLHKKKNYIWTLYQADQIFWGMLLFYEEKVICKQQGRNNVFIFYLSSEIKK